jgi:hypothetical protein
VSTRRCPVATVPVGSPGNSLSFNDLENGGGGNRTRVLCFEGAGQTFRSKAPGTYGIVARRPNNRSVLNGEDGLCAGSDRHRRGLLLRRKDCKSMMRCKLGQVGKTEENSTHARHMVEARVIAIASIPSLDRIHPRSKWEMSKERFMQWETKVARKTSRRARNSNQRNRNKRSKSRKVRISRRPRKRKLYSNR